MRNSTLIQAAGHRTLLVRRLSSAHSRIEIDRPLLQQQQLQRIHNVVARPGCGRIRRSPHRCFLSTNSLQKSEDDDQLHHHHHHHHQEEEITDKKQKRRQVRAPKNPAPPAQAKVNEEPLPPPPFDRQSFLAAMKSCVDASKRGDTDAPERAEALLEKLKASSKVPIDATAYAAVLGIWTRSPSKNEAAKRSLALLQEMEELYHQNGYKRCQPDAICYQAVIGILTKAQMPAHHAEHVWERMQTMGYIPNLLTCNSVLNCWAKSGHDIAGKKSQAMLTRMKVAPDIVSYNTVLQAYARAGDADSCLAILRELLRGNNKNTKTGIRPNTRTFTAVLAALSRSGSPTAAEQSESLLIRMQDLHDASDGDYDTKPNLFSYNSVLNCWARQSPHNPGAGARAEKILHSMKELDLAGERDVKPTIVSYNTVLHAYASSGGPDAVARSHALVQEMMQSGDPQLAPNESTYNTLLKTILTTTTTTTGSISRQRLKNGNNNSKKNSREQRAAETLRQLMEQRGFSKTPKAAVVSDASKSSPVPWRRNRAN